MGYDSHLGFPDKEGVFMNFNQAPVSVSYTPIPLWMRVTLGCVSDSSGQLLFYTNGCSIVNSNHEIIENGDSLNPGQVHDIQCATGYTSWIQSCLILPRPGHQTQYYLFHKKISYAYNPNFDVLTDTMYASLIDMSASFGHGIVLEKNIPVIETLMTAGQLTSVKHANGTDWWIRTGGDQNNLYYALLLTQEGVMRPFIQSIGYPSSYNGSRGGQANFSPDGTKYIRYSNSDGVFLFDFDRTTGQLSNFRHLLTPEETFADGIGVSPNSRYM